MRKRVGGERFIKKDKYISQELQVFNKFDVSKLYMFIYLAKESNQKKKDLTTLILNLQRVERRYETAL